MELINTKQEKETYAVKPAAVFTSTHVRPKYRILFCNDWIGKELRDQQYIFNCQKLSLYTYIEYRRNSNENQMNLHGSNVINTCLWADICYCYWPVAVT